MSYSSRRDFLINSAALSGAAALRATAPKHRPAQPRDPNTRLRIGSIGCGGKGLSDMRSCAKEHDIVALCDVDEDRAKAARKDQPQATFYHDYREMLDRETLDAVTISTPDHTHAGPALMAMLKGVHVFVQKPLTHTVAEARMLRDAARKTGVITSMGNQGTCLNGLRTAVEYVRAGAIGAVREVHVWTNRPVWPQGLEKPEHIDPIPATFRWDLWQGPAQWRSYAAGKQGTPFRGYAPFQWRGFWDFGTGALGDMACHIANMPFMALELGDPTWVEAESEGGTEYSPPKSSVIQFQFPKKGDREAVRLTWYDGGKRPPAELLPEVSLGAGGFLLIGDEGKLYSPTDYGERFDLYPKEKFADYAAPPKTLPRSPGIHKEWLDGILSGKQPMANFEYAAPFTEAILLGNLALRCGKRIEWDAQNLRVTNDKYADSLVRKEYRRGFELPEL